MVEHGANSRLFSGPGGSVIESPNIIKLIVPPEDEEKPVRFKRPVVLCLNMGDAARAETYYAQKLLQYRDAVEKLRNNVDPSTCEYDTFFCRFHHSSRLLIASLPHAIQFQFKIKSFRILSSDADRMFRDVPADGAPSPANVRRVDITKTSKSFECPQQVYSPLIEKVLPGTFKEVQPIWFSHLPTRLLEAMMDRQVSCSIALLIRQLLTLPWSLRSHMDVSEQWLSQHPASRDCPWS